MACSGQPGTICGGPNAISLYVNQAALTGVSSDLTTMTAALPTGWNSATTACIAEGPIGRALTGAYTTSDQMTPSFCASYCGKLGYALAGTEYTGQCFCGNALANGASLSLPSSACNMVCSGSKEICGGPNAISLTVNSVMAAPLSPDYTEVSVSYPTYY